MIRLIIAGSRGISDYDLFCKVLHKFFWRKLQPVGILWDSVEIVSGAHWEGVDPMGIKYAEDNGIALRKFPADWKGLGLKAGPVRNAEMAKYADVLFLVWDRKSNGSRNMLEQAKREGVGVFEVFLCPDTGCRFMCNHSGLSEAIEKAQLREQQSEFF